MRSQSGNQFQLHQPPYRSTTVTSAGFLPQAPLDAAEAAHTPGGASTRSAASSPMGQILKNPIVDVISCSLEKELGLRAIWRDLLVQGRVRARKYACKSVSKRKLAARHDFEAMRHELM